jgi:hypothetical protein
MLDSPLLLKTLLSAGVLSVALLLFGRELGALSERAPGKPYVVDQLNARVALYLEGGGTIPPQSDVAQVLQALRHPKQPPEGFGPSSIDGLGVFPFTPHHQLEYVDGKFRFKRVDVSTD